MLNLFRSSAFRSALARLLCLGFLLLSPAAPAQVAAGAMSGTVTSADGALVPRASIVVTDRETQAARTVLSNASGFYQVPDLAAGTYTVTTSAQGFATSIVDGVIITVGSTQTVPIALRVGSTTENITVEADTPTVDATTSTVSETVGPKTIVELPLNGRDWTSLAVLQPGVAQVRTQATPGINNTRDNRGLGNQLTVAGNRPQQNNYRLDGVSINDYSNGAPGSVLGVDLGVESIAEFSVITNNADATYGKTSGGVINAVSRSGTNALHGSAYGFFRNSALDARNYFDPRVIPDFSRKQFGASAGGPIRKNRTFIFGDYEGIRQNLGVTFNSTAVPTAAARSGRLCSTGSGCTPTTVTVNPAVANFLQLYPLPSGAISASGDTGAYSFAGQQVTSEDFFTIRGDHKIGAADTLLATYLFDISNSNSPDTFGAKQIGVISRRHVAVLEEQHVFSAGVVNSARIGYSRVVSLAPLTLGALTPLAADTSLGAIPGRAAPVVNVSGLSQFPGGLGSVGEFDYHYNSYQAYDDLLWSRGDHQIKTGFSFERVLSNGLGALNPNGNFTFPDLQSFLTNRPSNFNSPIGSIGVGLTPRDLRLSVVGGYLQDDWRIRRSLTFNLGLRYEMATVPTESKGKLATLVSPTDAAPRLGSPYFSNPTLKNFSPRVGLAWSPYGNGKTAVRGGFGVYDSLPLVYLFQSSSETAGPFYQTGSTSNAATLANSFTSGAYNLIAAAAAIGYRHIEQNPKRNYIMEWNLSVQQELPSQTTLTLGYIGSHGLHNPGQWDENIVVPIRTARGYMGNPTGKPLNPHPNVGAVTGTLWNGYSIYHGLNLGLRKKLTHGIVIQGSYTWQKAIDAGSATISGDTFLNSIVNQPFYFDPKVRRGPADFNVAHNAVINGLYELPSLKRSAAALRPFLNSWQFGGIFQASTGTPFTATVSGDPMQIKPHAGDTYDIADLSSANGCSSRTALVRHPGANPTYIKTECFAYPGLYLGNSGRNTEVGPGLAELDLSAIKNTRVPRFSETFNIQFRAEAFNILNRSNFAIPTGTNGGDRVLFSQTGVRNATAGQITTTTTTARQLQLAVKVLF